MVAAREFWAACEVAKPLPSSIRVTMDVYSHVTPGMDADAALVSARLVASASAGVTAAS